VLKVYRFAIRGNLTIGVPPGTVGFSVGPLGTTYASESRFDVSLLADGLFAGQHPFTVVQEAIDFWRTYLDEIERATAPTTWRHAFRGLRDRGPRLRLSAVAVLS
jgi:hypothetical protein